MTIRNMARTIEKERIRLQKAVYLAKARLVRASYGHGSMHKAYRNVSKARGALAGFLRALELIGV